MKQLKIIATLMLFFVMSTFVFAGSVLTNVQSENVIEPNVIVAALTPIVVWLATLIVTKIWNKIPTMLIMLVVTLLSWGYTQLTGVYEAGDTSYILQIVSGLGATFINEILKSANAVKSMSERRQK